MSHTPPLSIQMLPLELTSPASPAPEGQASRGAPAPAASSAHPAAENSRSSAGAGNASEAFLRLAVGTGLLLRLLARPSLPVSRSPTAPAGPCSHAISSLQLSRSPQRPCTYTCDAQVPIGLKSFQGLPLPLRPLRPPPVLMRNDPLHPRSHPSHGWQIEGEKQWNTETSHCLGHTALQLAAHETIS